MDVEDADGLEEIEDGFGGDGTEGSKDGDGVGVLTEDVGEGSEIFLGGDGGDDFVPGLLQGVGDGSNVGFDALDEFLIAEENNFTHRGRDLCCA